MKMTELHKAALTPHDTYTRKFDADIPEHNFVTVYTCFLGFSSNKREAYFEDSQVKPIFLDKYDAFRFSRFMCDGAEVVQLYVRESAIVGHNNVLSLKALSAGPANVMGHFLSLEQGEKFCENSDFDAVVLL